MNWINVLVVLGCLAAGYWIVSSVMSPGVDIKREERAPMRDWHLILDIPADASRRDIQAALKRRLALVDAVSDPLEADRIRRAAEAGLRQTR
jgi:hypothetical protein